MLFRQRLQTRTYIAELVNLAKSQAAVLTVTSGGEGLQTERD